MNYVEDRTAYICQNAEKKVLVLQENDKEAFVEFLTGENTGQTRLLPVSLLSKTALINPQAPAWVDEWCPRKIKGGRTGNAARMERV